MDYKMEHGIMLDYLKNLSETCNRKGANILDVDIDMAEAAALEQAIEELKKETVSRASYEHEYNLRKELDSENFILKRKVKALENQLKDKENSIPYEEIEKGWESINDVSEGEYVDIEEVKFWFAKWLGKDEDEL